MILTDKIISVRNLRYKVEIEKLIVVFEEDIKEIETLGFKGGI